MSALMQTGNWPRQRGSVLRLSSVAVAPEGVVSGNVVVGFGATAANLCIDNKGVISSDSVKINGNDGRVYCYLELSQGVDAHAGVRSWEVW